MLRQTTPVICSYLTCCKSRFRPLLLLAGSLLLSAIQSHAAPPSGYVLDWSDEFEGSSLDLTKWDYRVLGPRHSAVNVRDAVSLTNGVLTITTYTEGGTNFTGMIGTENLYMPLYGYMEARINFNDSPGEWSAFWMQSPMMGALGDPHAQGTEIDIVEHRAVNANGTKISGTGVANLHWDGYDEAYHKTVGSGRVGSGLSTGWHLYAMEWRKNIQYFYYDGVLVWAVTNSPAQDPVPPEAPVSQRSEYFILSSEVRDNYWAGAVPIGGYGSRASSITKMNVDYVRSYTFSSPTNGLPLDDAYVRNGTYTNTNFGAEGILMANLDAGSSSREIFLKFAVSDIGSDKRVFVRLMPKTVGSVSPSLAVEFVSNDNWSEGSLTWSNKPAGSGIIITNLTGLTANNPIMVDVTSLALNEAAVDEILSLRISSTTSNSNAYVDFFAQENAIAALSPVLIVTNSPPMMRATNLGAGNVGILYHGIHGLSYVLERSSNLLTWTSVATNTAPPGGLIAHTNSALPGAAFYRVRSNK